MPQPELNLQLTGKRLVVARVGWIAIAVLTIGLYALAIPLRFDELETVCPGAACKSAQLSIEDLRVLQGLGLSRTAHAAYNLGLEIFFAGVNFLIALIIFARRSNDRVALLVSLMLMTFGPVTFTGTMNALVQRSVTWQLPVGIVSPVSGALPDWFLQPYAVWQLPVGVVYAIGQFTFAFFFLVFPDGRLVPRWGIVPVVVWSIWQTLAAFFVNSPFNPANWSQFASAVVWQGFLFVFILLQVYRFRRVSKPVQQQQTKWVVFGLAAALAGYFFGLLIALMFNALGWSNLVFRQVVQTSEYVAMLGMPVSFGIAIMRSRLWDIDVIINRTLVYTIFTGVLLALYLVVVFSLQSIFTGITGQRQSDIAIVLSTLAIAVVFNPLRHRIQNGIDRRFYRRKYDATQVLSEFAEIMREEADLDRLAQQLVYVVQETMEPASVNLWLTTPDARRNHRSKEK